MTADLATLLQQQLAGGRPDPEALAALAAEDPQLAPIAQLLAARAGDLESELERQQDDELQERLRADQEALRRQRAAALRSHLDELTGELRHLQGLVDQVARALGACPACLGGTPGCPLCRGRGGPGSLPPDPAAFEVVVLPAVRACAYTRSRSRPATQRPPERETTRTHAREIDDLGRNT